MGNLLARFLANEQDNRNAEYQHQPFTPHDNPIGNALVQWAQGVKQRTINPLAALANEATRWRDMPVNQMAQEVSGNLTGGLGGLAAHTAWHGSPHLFDKFKNEAIGTGEGAQAYGHGLYLAENPKVAKQYQEQLTSGNGNYYRAEGAPEYSNQVLNSALDGYQVPFKENGLSPQEALQEVISKVKAERDWAANYYSKHPDTPVEFVDKTKYRTEKYLDALNQIDPAKVSENTGALYKTDIPDAHIDKMLDWDKPLSEQSQHVQDALGVIQRDHEGEAALLQKAQQLGVAPTLFPEYLQLTERMDAARQFSDTTGEQYYRSMGGNSGGTEHLSNLGIPGIKYLDGSSRAGGEGTRNFVMFNPSDIRILERNGQATGQKAWADK
jgi:hypothetical protein